MSKSLTIVALLTSLTLGGCLGGTGGSEFVDLSAYQRGKFHFNAGQFGLAVSHFQSAVRREPRSVEALNGLAASYDRLGRYDLSARYYGRALAADPESAQTLNNIGYSYLLQERFDLAVAYLRDAQSRDRKDPVVLANRNTAEVSYQEADLKRSAEEARTKRFATPTSIPSRPQVAAQALAAPTSVVSAPVVSAPAAPTQVASTPVTSSRRVKPWIERTAPRVQTLVSQPQVALIGAIEEVGIDPQLAAYRPQQPTASELLPDHAAAPMTLDARVPAEPGAAILWEVRATPSNSPSVPRAPDQPLSTPIAGLAPTEVTVASLDSLPAMEGIADPVSSGGISSGGVSREGGGILASGLSAGSVAPMGRGPQESVGAVARLMPVAPRTTLPDHLDATRPAPIEVLVASLDATRDLSDVAPSQGQPTGAAITELVTPEVVLRDLDPLDALEDDLLEADLFEDESGPLSDALELAPELAPGVAEVEVARLSTVVSDAPRVELRPAVAVSVRLPLVEVSNGTGRLDMAARIRDHLETKGIVVKRLTNAEDFRQQETTIFYRSGWRTYAEELARMLPAVIDLDGSASQESDIRLELGGDLLEFDRDLYYATKRPNGAARG